MVKVDLSGVSAFFDPAELDFAAASMAHRELVDRTGAGSDFTGWLELPQRIKDTELKSILSAAQRIRSRSKALVVIGIGGSYLGARGAIELLRPVRGENDPKIFFIGNGLSPDALNDMLQQLGDCDFDVNVISKSGTTLEPAVAFRIFRKLLKEKYGTAAKKHIFATTDAHKGVLKSLADSEGWECFVVPDDVGGRYSVLSAVGLLPMAVAGIDIKPSSTPLSRSSRHLTCVRRRILRGSTPQQDSIFTATVKALKFSAAMSRASASWPSGGNSFTVKARAKTASASSPPRSS